MTKTVKLYAIVTQGFIQTLILAFLGYMLGAKWWLKEAVWGGVFAILGAIIGIVFLVITLLKVGKTDDK